MSSERPKDPTASEMLEVRPEDFYLGDKVAWEGPRLAVTDPATIGKLRRKALSPSTAAAMEDCTARWAIERLLPRSNNPFGAAELGTAAHAVLEDLYKLPSFQRSEEKAMNILLAHAKEAWPGQDEETFAKRGMWISEVNNAYKGLFELEDPTQIRVYQTEMAFQDVTVAGVPVIGYIDRVDEVEGGLAVRDYKSGKVPTSITKFGDHQGDQLRIYTKAVEAMLGVTPVEATLLYTKHAKSRVVPISKPAMNKTLKAFAHAWDTHNELMDQASFTTKVGALCGWCPAVGACPIAKAEGKADRTGSAPDGTWLGIPTLRPYIPPTVVEEIVAESQGTQPSNTALSNPFDPGFADEMPSHEPDLAPDEQVVTPVTAPAASAPAPVSGSDFEGREPDLAPDEQVVSPSAPATQQASVPVPPRPAPLGPVIGGTTVVTADGRIVVVDADGNEIGAPTRSHDDAAISVPEFAVTAPDDVTATHEPDAGPDLTDQTREPDVESAFDGVPAFAPTQLDLYAPNRKPYVDQPDADFARAVNDRDSAPAADAHAAAQMPDVAPALAVLAGEQAPARQATAAAVTQVPTSDHHTDNLPATGHPGPATTGGESNTSSAPSSAHRAPVLAAAVSGELMTQQTYLFSEDKPFHERSNGLLNGASYASTAVFGLASLAYEEIQAASQPLKSETIDALTQTLASVVLQAQYVLTGSTAYQDGLNTRLRGALRSVMAQNPLPWGESGEEWKKWHTKAVSHVVSIANVAHRLYNAEIPAAPWAALASGPATPIAQEFIA